MRPFRERLRPSGRMPAGATRTVRYVCEVLWRGRECGVWWQEVPNGAYLWVEDPWGKRHRLGWYVPGDGRRGLTRSAVEEMLMRYLKSALKGANGQTTLSQCQDDWLGKFAPALAEFCTCPKGPDGKERETSTLTVFYEDGQCKVCLGERNYNLSLWASGATLMEALMALEARLTAPVVEWRSRGQKNGPKRHGAK